MVMEMERVGAPQRGTQQGTQRGAAWRWKVDWYVKAAELGWFEGRRVELIDGEIIQMNPINEPHAVGMNKLQRQFNRKLPDALFVRGQSPLYIKHVRAT